MALTLLPIRKDTRIFGAAASILPLSLLLLAQHKHGYYFVHELTLLSAGLWSAAAALAGRVLPNRDSPGQARLRLVLASGLAVALVAVRPRSDLRITTHPRVHEAEVARAAALTMLGPTAVVGGRTGSWYLSGAHRWVGLEVSAVWTGRDVLDVISAFDAVVESVHMSNTPLGSQDGPILSSMYADGTLHLRGFFAANQLNPNVGYVLLGATPPQRVVGYAIKAGTTFEIVEDRDGDHLIDVAVCRSEDVRALRSQMLFSQELVRPGGPSDATYVVTLVRDRRPLPAGCRIAKEWRAIVTPIDGDALIERARRLDRPMEFDTRAPEARRVDAKR
jgi:hypothetical protein